MSEYCKFEMIDYLFFSQEATIVDTVWRGIWEAVYMDVI